MEKCYSCGGQINIIKDKPYKYDECGLNVVLYGITQYECSNCGESYASIPDINRLHRLIGIEICKNRKAILKPQEIKFLRKSLQCKAKELSQIIGVNPSTFSRWENGQQDIGEAHDRLLRSLYFMCSIKKDHKEACGEIFDFFKRLPSKRKKIEESKEIKLNPPEWLNPIDESAVAPKGWTA